jgi:hypothetical protein
MYLARLSTSFLIPSVGNVFCCVLKNCCCISFCAALLVLNVWLLSIGHSFYLIVNLMHTGSTAFYNAYCQLSSSPPLELLQFFLTFLWFSYSLARIYDYGSYLAYYLRTATPLSAFIHQIIGAEFSSLTPYTLSNTWR